MCQEAVSVVELGADHQEIGLRRSAFMRYAGQGHEIEIALPDHDLTSADIPELTARFEAEYRVQFSRPVPGMVIEILNWAVYASTSARVTTENHPQPVDQEFANQKTVSITCDVAGGLRQAQVVDRAELRPGHIVQGPALISEPQTTTLVSADFCAQVDGLGNLVLTQNVQGEMS
ncbi:MAG: hypothetical protein ACU0BB_12285 [Paracoccaceae bacterium]